MSCGRNFIKILIGLGCILLESSWAVKGQPRIVGGQPYTISQAKFVVQIRRQLALCGGCLITSRWVITAAHCMFGNQMSEYRVIGNTTYLSDTGGVERSVIFVALPPGFNIQTMNMDAALLKLDSDMTGSYVQPIWLGGGMVVGDRLRAFGWGYTSERSGSSSNQLRSVVIPVWPNRQCVSGSRDTCYGDSGGPVIFKNRLVGIVSYGVGCARVRYPGVYTRVGLLEKWVRRVILNNQ